jgi:hypothetical protein
LRAEESPPADQLPSSLEGYELAFRELRGVAEQVQTFLARVSVLGSSTGLC